MSNNSGTHHFFYSGYSIKLNQQKTAFGRFFEKDYEQTVAPPRTKEADDDAEAPVESTHQ